MISSNGLVLAIDLQRRRELAQQAEKYRLGRAARKSRGRNSLVRRGAKTLKPATVERMASA
jgi:hypothetical protein